MSEKNTLRKQLDSVSTSSAARKDDGDIMSLVEKLEADLAEKVAFIEEQNAQLNESE